jgi:hypothetical protein
MLSFNENQKNSTTKNSPQKTIITTFHTKKKTKNNKFSHLNETKKKLWKHIENAKGIKNLWIFSFALR